MNKFLRSFGYAWKGIRTAFNSELNMKIHVVFTISVVLMGVILCISVFEWIAVILCIGIVLVAEMFNTAFETLVDKISPEKDSLAGKTKDIAAGAVLIASIISAVIGAIIFVPKILKLFL